MRAAKPLAGRQCASAQNVWMHFCALHWWRRKRAYGLGGCHTKAPPVGAHAPREQRAFTQTELLPALSARALSTICTPRAGRRLYASAVQMLAGSIACARTPTLPPQWWPTFRTRSGRQPSCSSPHRLRTLPGRAGPSSSSSSISQLDSATASMASERRGDPLAGGSHRMQSVGTPHLVSSRSHREHRASSSSSSAAAAPRARGGHTWTWRRPPRQS